MRIRRRLAISAVLFCLFALSAACDKAKPHIPSGPELVVHWALSPGGLGDMGYNDIIYAGISSAAERNDFVLHNYRPDSVEQMLPVIEEWLREPLGEGSRSLFVLGASDYEPLVRTCMDRGIFPLPAGKDMLMLEYFKDDLPVYTIGIVTAAVAYLAGCLSREMDRTPLVVAATLADPQTQAAAEAFCMGADPEGAGNADILELSPDFSGFYMADSLYRMCPELMSEYDFFFPYAGGSALGMYRYMRDNSGDWLVVGMDMDQTDLAPDNMCCSMIKEINRAIVMWMDSYAADEELPSRSIYGIESGLVSLHPSPGYEELVGRIAEQNMSEALAVEAEFTEILCGE